MEKGNLTNTAFSTGITFDSHTPPPFPVSHFHNRFIFCFIN